MTTERPNHIVFERHGHSTLNAVQAESPVFFKTHDVRAPFANMPDHEVPLSTRGVEEARAVGKLLKVRSFKFDALYDSGYKRTVETLNYNLEVFSHIERKQMARKSDILIREREVGYTYFMTEPEIDANYPWYKEYWQTLGPVFARPIGGESIADIIPRVEQFLDHMFTECEGQNVLVVTHGRVISAVRYILEKWDYKQLEAFIKGHGPRNCSLTIYGKSRSTGMFELAEYDTLYILDRYFTPAGRS